MTSLTPSQLEDLSVDEMLSYCVSATLNLRVEDRPSFVSYCMNNLCANNNPITRSIVREFERRLIEAGVISKVTTTAPM